MIDHNAETQALSQRLFEITSTHIAQQPPEPGRLYVALNALAIVCGQHLAAIVAADEKAGTAALQFFRDALDRQAEQSLQQIAAERKTK